MTELKPCPCCGPKAFIIPSTKCDPQAGKHCWTAELRCHECGLNISRSAATEKEALYEAINAWNTRVERTCTMTKLEPPLLLEGWWSCSECGPVFPPCNDEIAVWVLQQCPHCGAKVVE